MGKAKRNALFLFVKQIIRELCRFSNANKTVGYALFSKKRRYFTLEDEVVTGKSSCCALQSDVPKGHFAVYVGNERSRFIIPTTYLNHSLFRTLLQKAEEEYGFDQQMGITIPCEEAVFEYLTSMLGKKNPDLINMELDEVIGMHCH